MDRRDYTLLQKSKNRHYAVDLQNQTPSTTI